MTLDGSEVLALNGKGTVRRHFIPRSHKFFLPTLAFQPGGVGMQPGWVSTAGWVFAGKKGDGAGGDPHGGLEQALR